MKGILHVITILFIVLYQSVNSKEMDMSNRFTFRYEYGFIDRIEDGSSVILVERLQKEFIVTPDSHDLELKPNMWLSLLIIKDKIINLSVDTEMTIREKKRVDILKKKLKGEK